jgi:hypothetical protein
LLKMRRGPLHDRASPMRLLSPSTGQTLPQPSERQEFDDSPQHLNSLVVWGASYPTAPGSIHTATSRVDNAEVRALRVL